MKKPNPWGLHDMLGNVSEWSSDYWGYKRAGGTDPIGPPPEEDGSVRVVRGGHFFECIGGSTSACRFTGMPEEYTDFFCGMRVAIVRATE